MCIRETISRKKEKKKGISTLDRFYQARLFISTTYTVARGQRLFARLTKRQIKPYKEKEKSENFTFKVI